MEYRAFGSCSSLRSAVLPEGITVLPDSLFMGCTELQFVVLPGSVVTIDENAFAQCGSLRSSGTPWTSNLATNACRRPGFK